MVAYRLELPRGSSIFPVFHISLLIPFVGSLEEGHQLTLPTKAVDTHPLIVPASIVGYRIISHKGQKREQVLVDWIGLPPLDRTWEDLRWVAHLNPNSNLEDKVCSAREGDVTVLIDQAETEQVLAEELELAEGSIDPVPVPTDPDPPCPTRTRKTTRDEDFMYD